MKQHRRTNSINPSPILPPLQEESDAEEIDYAVKSDSSLYSLIVGSPSRWAISFGLTVLFILLCVQAFEKIGNRWGRPPYPILSPEIISSNLMLELAFPVSVNGKCENTQQGKDLITDSGGYVCKRETIDPKTQCCKRNTNQLEHPTGKLNGNVGFSCHSCNLTTSCCASYEYCVSCCMDPSRASLKPSVIESNQGQLDSLRGERDPFKYCRAVCRTSSKSVFAINQYRNTEKHCYGPNGPPIGDEQAKLVGIVKVEEKTIPDRKHEPPFLQEDDFSHQKKNHAGDSTKLNPLLVEFRQTAIASSSSAERKNIAFTFLVSFVGLIILTGLPTY